MGLKTSTRLTGAIAFGAVAISLAAVAPANAALGNAKPGTLTLNPNLVSVSVSGNQAVYRFDRALENGTPAANNFTLTSNADATNAAYTGQSAQVNGSTVRVGFGSDNDLTKAVAGNVAANTVTTDNNTQQNLADAAPISTTNSKDGTRGVSAAPRLIGVERQSTNVLVYQFDRELTTAAPASAFRVSDAGSGNTQGNTATVSEDKVTVTFNNGSAVLNAANSAFVADGAATSASPVAGAGNNTNAATRVTLPGKTLTSARTVLTGAALKNNSFGYADNTNVEFTFSDAPTAVAAGSFQLVLANGQRVNGSTADVDPNNGKVVSVSFNTTGVQEYAVAAVAGTGAATTGNGANLVSDAPLGGNPGASAAGFTVAPEVLKVEKTDSNQIAVTVDTRLTAAPGPITLLSAEGQTLGTVTTGTAAAAYQGQPGVKVLFYDVPSSVALQATTSISAPAGTFTSKLGASLAQVVGL